MRAIPTLGFSCPQCPDPDRPFVAGESANFLRDAEEIRRISRPASDGVDQVGANHFVRTLGAAN